MSYKVLMVHLQTGADNAGLLAVTADLAKRFDASVIGIAACQPVQLLAEEGFVAGEVIAESYAELKKEIAAAEAQFRSALGGRVKHLQWRSAITYLALADYLAEQARAADLIITGKQSGGSLFDSNRAVNVGALVLQAGRPVLVVPEGISSLPMEQVFLGWKDSREARHAAADALPLLAMAESVTVLAVGTAGQQPGLQAQTADVAAWLDSHGIAASPAAVTATGPDAAALHLQLRRRKCDLLVAGVYGHSRVREWVFGGVTCDFLLDPDFCVLLSH